jgi:hypothetical protein
MLSHEYFHFIYLIIALTCGDNIKEKEWKINTEITSGNQRTREEKVNPVNTLVSHRLSETGNYYPKLKQETEVLIIISLVSRFMFISTAGPQDLMKMLLYQPWI